MSTIKNSIASGLAGLAFGGLMFGAGSVAGVSLTHDSLIVTATLMGCALVGAIMGAKFKLSVNATKTQEAVKSQMSVIPESTKTPGPMIFKGGTVHTLITPIGSYAGKSSAQPLRALAEKRFNETNSSRGATIN